MESRNFHSGLDRWAVSLDFIYWPISDPDSSIIDSRFRRFCFFTFSCSFRVSMFRFSLIFFHIFGVFFFGPSSNWTSSQLGSVWLSWVTEEMVFQVVFALFLQLFCRFQSNSFFFFVCFSLTRSLPFCFCSFRCSAFRLIRRFFYFFPFVGNFFSLDGHMQTGWRLGSPPVFFI